MTAGHELDENLCDDSQHRCPPELLDLFMDLDEAGIPPADIPAFQELFT